MMLRIQESSNSGELFVGEFIFIAPYWVEWSPGLYKTKKNLIDFACWRVVKAPCFPDWNRNNRSYKVVIQILR
jgi:hypothetical protein